MTTDGTEERIFLEVKNTMELMGYSLVEHRLHGVREKVHVYLKIYRPEGVGLKDCAHVHRIIEQKIKMILDNENVHLEVSTPGINRELKSSHEYTIFKGKGIKILKGTNTKWVTGKIEKTDKEGVTLSQKNGTLYIPFDEIRRAKLDSAQEV